MAQSMNIKPLHQRKKKMKIPENQLLTVNLFTKDQTEKPENQLLRTFDFYFENIFCLEKIIPSTCTSIIELLNPLNNTYGWIDGRMETSR